MALCHRINILRYTALLQALPFETPWRAKNRPQNAQESYWRAKHRPPKMAQESY